MNQMPPNPNFQYAPPYPQNAYAPNPNLNEGMMQQGQQMPYPAAGCGPMNPPGVKPYPPQGNLAIDAYEESYIENIVRLNKGKIATFYMTYSDSLEWRDRSYKGIIEAAGKDHIVISDSATGKRFILLDIYLDWIEFNEEIEYEYPIR